MTYSPYGDRDSGGTRTDVDTEVHDDHDQEDRVDDGVGHDANGPDANGHDGTATPFQRDSTDDETVGGDVVDQDGNVVEAADGDIGEGDRSETVDAESAESAESAGAPDAVDTEHTDTPDTPDTERADTSDAEANADDVAVTETEAGTDEDPDGDVQADEATATDVDAPEDAEGTAERDDATEQAMAGDDGPTEVPADVVNEHNRVGDDDEVGERDGVGEYSEAGGDNEVGEHGEAVGAGYSDAAVPAAVNADPAGEAYADVTEADQIAATDGTLDDDRTYEMPDGDAPVAGAVDADYVAVGVAEPMTESEVADIGGADATRDADDGTAPLDAAPLDAAAVDGTVTEVTAVGMMPGDAPVPDAPAQVPNAEATHDRWQQIQLGFIDDPRGSVESARSLVVEAVEARISALRDRQTALDGWQSEATPDTEVLRAAIQGYRDMLNSLTDTP